MDLVAAVVADEQSFEVGSQARVRSTTSGQCGAGSSAGPVIWRLPGDAASRLYGEKRKLLARRRMMLKLTP